MTKISNNYNLVVTVSSSGNSKNIINIIDCCNENDINTLSISWLKPDNSNLFWISLWILKNGTETLFKICHQMSLIYNIFLN